jgi:rfaE bifunctional protein nucleotidyltransferase chain/domain
VFDLLHPGHVDVLVAAARAGNALIVGINSDASVRRLNKSLVARPIQRAEDRAMMVASLECVDRVVIFDEDTPRELIVALRPSVVVKGGDYTPATVVGAEEVKAWKGKVVIVPTTPGYSTSSIISGILGKPASD